MNKKIRSKKNWWDELHRPPPWPLKSTVQPTSPPIITREASVPSEAGFVFRNLLSKNRVRGTVRSFVHCGGIACQAHKRFAYSFHLKIILIATPHHPYIFLKFALNLAGGWSKINIAELIEAEALDFLLWFSHRLKPNKPHSRAKRGRSSPFFSLNSAGD